MVAYRVLYRCYGAQDLIVAQTDHMARKLAEVLAAPIARKLVVAANPIDRARIAAMADEQLAEEERAALRSRPHIAWCGRLIAIKQPLLALACLTAARRQSGRDLALAMMAAGRWRRISGDRRRPLGLKSASVFSVSVPIHSRSSRHAPSAW
jgi:hypothetical protein